MAPPRIAGDCCVPVKNCKPAAAAATVARILVAAAADGAIGLRRRYIGRPVLLGSMGEGEEPAGIRGRGDRNWRSRSKEMGIYGSYGGQPGGVGVYGLCQLLHAVCGQTQCDD